MENTTNNNQLFIESSVDNLSIGDMVYLKPDLKSQAYQIIDKGTPFILVENIRTHFCSLYRVTHNLYKLCHSTPTTKD